ncbi:hypothetical protein [Aminobacter aminovorans]|jgi:hypothetical protein|uniref:hypothetical protein n=1 Tax=Aminobacter TaxID=31988 RepID=UPI002859BA30|nr:hypothetical protein [Aminobacter aminovorans]MDR7222670.1 hypothetical protein [Aminobacter aminovorans]
MSDGPKMLAALSTKKAATDHHKIGAAFLFRPAEAWQHRHAHRIARRPVCRHNILTPMRQDKARSR